MPCLRVWLVASVALQLIGRARDPARSQLRVDMLGKLASRSMRRLQSGDVTRDSRVLRILPITQQMQLVAAIAFVLAPAPADGQTERHLRPADDLVIEMMNTRTHALAEYMRCLEGNGLDTPCEPPRPIQLPPRRATAQDRSAQSEAMIESAARMLKNAEMRAIKAHAKCVPRKQAQRCGPPP